MITECHTHGRPNKVATKCEHLHLHQVQTPRHEAKPLSGRPVKMSLSEEWVQEKGHRQTQVSRAALQVTQQVISEKAKATKGGDKLRWHALP